MIKDINVDSGTSSLACTKPIVSRSAFSKCSCLKCSPNIFPNIRFNVCSSCGNKRCPHASDHNFKCTKSNDVGQVGIVIKKAFGVYPDSVGMDLSSENKLLAVFKYEEQARIFGAKMWGKMYVIKELLSEHFC